MFEIFLNRLRGTGDIFKIFGFALTGNIIYAVYIALLIGFTYYFAIFGSINVDVIINLYFTTVHIVFQLSETITAIICGLTSGLLYMLGESMGWGKWVGSLCHPESTITFEARYADDEGIRFPFIHKTANAIVKEREDYLRYCQIALAIRGLYWWLPLLTFMAMVEITSYWLAILGSILLGIGFPLACYIGSKLDYNGKFWKIHYSKGWENQELVYGLMQGIVLWAVVLLG